jgi:hypothetical protein
VLAAGCDDAGEGTAPFRTVPPGTSITTERVAPWLVPTSTVALVAEPTDHVLEAVVVAVGQSVAERIPGRRPQPRWWMVLDLENGALIEGSSRVLVEMPDDEEVGCDDDFVFAHQVAEGEVVSFELVAGEPGPRPEDWMMNASVTFEFEPAARGQRFRVEACAGRTYTRAV